MIAKHFACVAALVAAMAPAALAQQLEDGVADQTPQSSGPMKLERVESGFLFIPSVKITELNHDTSTLVGGDAGWLQQEAMFYGVGVYGLVNGHHDSLIYGGFVFQFQSDTNKTVGFALRGLLGGGEATITNTQTVAVYPPRGSNAPIAYVPQEYHYHQPVFVAEPEADVLIRLGRNVHVKAGIGYRFVGTYYWGHYGSPYGYYGDTDHLQGATATLGVQLFGGGS